MDYKLDRKILLTSDIETSLYSWCFQELNENGEKVGQDQIPFTWGNRFVASNLRYSVQMYGEIESLNLVDSSPVLSTTEQKVNKLNDAAIALHEHINATLSSKDNESTYSMFGTERQVQDILLNIYKDDDERCYSHGFPSHSYEIDFSEIEQQDCIEFNLFIKPERFEKILSMINSGSVQSLQFWAEGVMGFYSEWSPSIRANKVKVLCGEDYHKFEIAKNCVLSPAQSKKIPRLSNQVFKFGLTIIQNQDKETSSPNEDDDPHENLDPHEMEVDKSSLELVNTVNKLNTKVSLILILLGLILVFK
jgi:hypothetical protein